MTNKELMSAEKFIVIMNTLIEHQANKNRISDFFEKELMKDSWCFLTFGNELEDTIVHMLADEFDCWFIFTDFENKELPCTWWDGENHYGYGNDIEEWLYSMDDKKVITVNGVEHDVTDLGVFYDYLVEQYNEKHNLTK